MQRIAVFICAVGLCCGLGIALSLDAQDENPIKIKPKQPTLLQAKQPDNPNSESKSAKINPKVAEKEKSPLAKFMYKKLDASNLILEGLVTENFGKIEKGAKQLETMSEAEQWRVSNDVIYRQLSEDFRRVAKQLQKDSDNATADAAALTWIKITMSCIECHKYTKGILISDLP